MNKLIKILFFIFAVCSNSFGEDISSILKSINNFEDIPPHCGTRVSTFYKEGKEYTSKTEIKFKSIHKFKMTTIAPESQEGNIFGSDGERFMMYIPKYRIKSISDLPDFTKIQEQRPRGGGGAGFVLNCNLDKLFKRYEVKLSKDSENYIISIKSKRKPSHRWEIWVNREKKLITKQERFFEGKLYYKFYYEKLEFRMPTDEEMKIKIPVLAISLPTPKDEGVVYYSPTEARKNLKNIPHLKNVPPGFEFIFCRKRKEMGGDTIFVRYSDGLLNILLQKREKKHLDGILKLLGGDMLEDFQNYAIPNSYDKESDKETITIQGEFPENLLKSFLE